MLLKKIILFLFILSTLSFALQIDSLKFDKKLKKNTKISKSFLLINDSNEEKTYLLSIEGNNNVQVKPKILNIKAFQEKEFFIEVTGKKEGNEHYFLIIKDSTPSSNKNEEGLEIIKILKILQNYTVI